MDNKKSSDKKKTLLCFSSYGMIIYGIILIILLILEKTFSSTLGGIFFVYLGIKNIIVYKFYPKKFK